MDRIDQNDRLRYSDTTNADADYINGLREGQNTKVYIVDSGIDVNHPEFEGRASWGYVDPTLPEEDESGHGTHVAGLVGSKSYGVAHATEMSAVKIVDHLGRTDANKFLAALDWVLADHKERTGFIKTSKSVLLVTINFAAQNRVDDGVLEMFDGGIPVVSSAGNDNANACENSPGRVPEVLNIGKINRDLE